MAVITSGSRPARTAATASFLYRPEVRQAIYQIVLVVALATLFYILISNTASPCKALTGFRGSLRHVRLGANNGSIGDDVGVGRGEIQAPELEPRRRDALMTSWQQTLAFMIMAAH